MSDGTRDQLYLSLRLAFIENYCTNEEPLPFIADDIEYECRLPNAFLADPPFPVDSIMLNINMDMIGRNDEYELYAAGTYHNPELLPLVEAVADSTELDLLVGHDRPNLAAGMDWTMLSDHGAFHERGIPFIYFGVEDHVDYHQPTDTYDKIDPVFFVRAVATVLDFVREADERWVRPAR